MQKMLRGPNPVDQEKKPDEYFWGGEKTVAIEKDKVTKTKKKPNQQTTRKKTVTNKRKAGEPEVIDVSPEKRNNTRTYFSLCKSQSKTAKSVLFKPVSV